MRTVGIQRSADKRSETHRGCTSCQHSQARDHGCRGPSVTGRSSVAACVRQECGTPEQSGMGNQVLEFWKYGKKIGLVPSL
eukprot:224466-Rhodomonas_salina.2